MKKNMVEMIGSTFAYGFVKQLESTELFSLGIGVGIHQGLKYNGSLKRGVVSGLTTVAAIGVVSGVRTVWANRETIKNTK